MALTYDPVAKKWNVAYEKADYQTDRPIASTFTVTVQGTKLDANGKPGFVDYTVTLPVGASYEDIKTALYQTGGFSPFAEQYGWDYWRNAVSTIEAQQESTQQTNNYNTQLNQQGAQYNAEATKKNQAYDSTVSLASTTKGGDYVQVRDRLRQLGVDAGTLASLEDSYKSFYRTEKLQQWDTALGAKPPYGTFDSAYYKAQNPTVADAWKNAVANDDIDITERYGENGYYLQHYTTQGKPAGLRGNAAAVTSAAQA